MPPFTVLYRTSQGISQHVSLSLLGYVTVPSPDIYACGVSIGELNNVKGKELVVASGTDLKVEPYHGRISVFDSSGNRLWTFTSPTYQSFGMDVAVGDVDDDGNNEIAFATNYQEAKVYLLDKNGNELWHWSAHGTGYEYTRGVAIGKVRNDYNHNQVVVSGFNSQLALLDYLGNEIWFINVGSSYTVQTVKIADTNADGQAEIIVSHERYVRKFDHLSNLVWATVVGDANCTAIGIDVGHVTSLSEMQIATGVYPRFGVGTIKRCVLLNKDGNEIWHWDAPYGCSGIKVADVNGDGYDEVIVGYGNHDNETPNPAIDRGGISVLDRNGNELCSLSMPSTVGFIAWGDANNDGKNEIFAACDDGRAYVIGVILS